MHEFIDHAAHLLLEQTWSTQPLREFYTGLPDALFIPALWRHEVISEVGDDGLNIAVNYSIGTWLCRVAGSV